MRKNEDKEELSLEKKKEIRWDQLGGRVLTYVDKYHSYENRERKTGIKSPLEYTIDYTGVDERGIQYEFINKNKFEELSPGLQRIVREFLEWDAKKRNRTLEDRKQFYFLDI